MNPNSKRTQMINLSWAVQDPVKRQHLMVLSGYGAIEFAESLRLFLAAHPENLALRQMASEELETTNLSFEDYNRAGDHSEFLWYFIRKYGLNKSVPKYVFEAGEEYVQMVKTLPLPIRTMSIVSRENDLQGIFAKMREPRDWLLPGLPAYFYYLGEHIELDSGEGGHADQLRGFEVTEEVDVWYGHRVDMYHCVPELFVH